MSSYRRSYSVACPEIRCRDLAAKTGKHIPDVFEGKALAFYPESIEIPTQTTSAASGRRRQIILLWATIVLTG